MKGDTNEPADMERMLAPRCEFRASGTLAGRVMERAIAETKARPLRLWPYVAAACVAGAVAWLCMSGSSAVEMPPERGGSAMALVQDSVSRTPRDEVASPAAQGVQVAEARTAARRSEPVRPQGSSSGEGSRMIYLDGEPYSGQLSSVSSMEVESFTVLKDSLSLAMLGDVGTESVIVIVTNRGREQAADAANTGSPSFGSSRNAGGLTYVDDLLRGRVAGLDIRVGGMKAGGRPLAERPLIVVDEEVVDEIDEARWRGFSFGDSLTLESVARFIAVDTADIKEVRMLRDRVATSVWGVRGVNGVIEIDTSRNPKYEIQITESDNK